MDHHNTPTSGTITYAQFDQKGELAMVSGFLADRALKESDVLRRGGEKEA